MPFIPDTIYGIAYLTALIVSGALTLLGSSSDAKRILLVLTIHWLTTRAIDVYDHTNFYLWIVQDYAVFFAMLFYCRGIAGRACAALFFVVLSFDFYSLMYGGSFEGAAAVAETVGYFSMLIMAGGAHADRGKRAWHSGNLRARDAGIRNMGKSWRETE